MTQEEIQDQVNQTEVIYAEFRTKLHELKKEQDTMVTEFLKDLENNKLQEIRNIIANS